MPCRAAGRIPQDAKSVIIFAFPYLLPDEKYEGLNISRYAVPRDYHEVAGEMLKNAVQSLSEKYPDEKFEAFIDNSPVPEVYTACLAGIGVKGENSLFITEKYGSFVFLGEIITTAFLEPTGSEPGHCLKCGRCVSACPGGAIKDGKVNTDLCLSHITQKKGELSEKEKELIKSTGCVWGCDICQRVCPMNKNAKTTHIPEFLSSAVSKVTEDTPLDNRAFAWRGEKVIRRNLKTVE